MTQETWKKSRRAILHTLDISRKHSVHAKKIVQGWRHGMYAGNVDFHVGDVSGWIASQKVLRKTEEPFLSHVFLDLPGADAHLANVAPALHVNGIVAVFNPSITQIAECVDLIRTQKLPYLLDQIIELGVGNIREWDVRSVRPRASLKKAASPDSPETTETAETTEAAEPSSGEAGDAVKGQEARDGELAEEVAKTEEKWAMICRPKAGSMVVGGGFLALWRRMEHTPRQEAEGEQMKQ
jgi:tRNA (adenine57-N1/adenine58-N1)-methyltransferase